MAFVNGVMFTVDCGGQQQGSLQFRHIPQAVQSNAFYDEPNPPDNYAVSRWEGTQQYGFGWFAEDTSPARSTPWATNAQGDIIYTPTPAHKAFFDTTLRWGLTPLVVMGTSCIPTPLMEGGRTTGEYGYPVRQPISYAKWHTYLRSMFQWLADTYGREAVRNWCFMFGIEMDWQIKCVYPGTSVLMNEVDNRQECIKMLDYWIDAAEQVLGSQLYMGCYYAFPGQADAYVKHWAEGINAATGRVGTNIGWFGFSDWSLLSEDSINPFSPVKRKNPEKSIGMTFAAGLKWKSDYLNALTSKYLRLRALEIHTPECGYFDSYGGTDARGQICAGECDFADHHGAALYNMRSICAAEQPNIALAWNRYALTTGDLGLLYYHAVLPPVFHAVRISKRLEGSRVLPVVRRGTAVNPEADLRAAAFVEHDAQCSLRCLLVHLREDITAKGKEPYQIELTNLPIEHGVVQADITTIDESCNNWWSEWLRDRDRYNIAYHTGPNQGHLGKDITLAPLYAPLAIDIRATVDAEGWAKWAKLAPKYLAKSALRVTRSVRLHVENGTAKMSGTLDAFGSLYIEVKLPVQPLKRRDVSLMAPGWERSGVNRQGNKLTMEPLSAGYICRELHGLEPVKRYTVCVDVELAHRCTDVMLQAGQGDTAVQATALKHPRPQQLCVTTRADARGRLFIKLYCPKQPLRKQDIVAISNLKIYAQQG